MSGVFANDAAVIVPARNEEARIGACLTALAGQCTGRVTVIVLINNTADRTGAVARETAARHGLRLVVLERSLPPNQGVGTARAIGCDHALHTMPDLQYLLTTDADCVVNGDWITRNIAHLETADAVCGKIDLIAEEADILGAMDCELATMEGRYRDLVQDFYADHEPGSVDIRGTHGEAAGASLAFSKAAYLAVGGFAPLKCGEDRRIVRALRRAGYTVRHGWDIKVQASCRLTGRATGGMSDALRARISGLNYMVDDCLPPADWLIRHAKLGTLGPWPPHVPAHLRLNVQALPRHITMLESQRNPVNLIAPRAPMSGDLAKPAQFL